VTLVAWRELAASVAALAGPVPGEDEVSVHNAAGRVLARDLRAVAALPARALAVMDGYALGASPPGAFTLRDRGAGELGPAEAVPIQAGEPIPTGAACVVLADKGRRDGATLHVPMPQVKDNIRRRGEEAEPDMVLLRAGTRLDARHGALASAAGATRLHVRRRPNVILLALNDGDARLPHLAVMESLLDTPLLALRHAGSVRTTALGIALERAAADADLVLCIADSLGDSAGPLADAIRAAGGTSTAWRAALKPAKPIVGGRIGDATILGLCGTAYATTVAAHLFLRPLLRVLAGIPDRDVTHGMALGFGRPREPGRAEALPVLVDRSRPDPILREAGRFGQLKALAAMDGFAMIESEAGAVSPGQSCQYHPLSIPLV
jgi:molybdopterin molybdotransferase